MAVTKQQKAEILEELVVKFKEAKSIGFSATNKVTVSEFAKLRKDLREVNATYTLAKKTIIKLALKEATGIDVETEQLPGQIWVVCSNEDPIAGLSKVNAFMKEANGPKGNLGKVAWALSIIDGEVKDLEETKVLASMPSRETLLGRLVWSMKSPISKLARFFDAAAKEIEAQWKETIGQLEKEAPKTEEVKEETPAEVKEEAPKAEEVKEEAHDEIKEETPKAEEVKEEAPAETKEEAPKVEEVKEEAPAEAKEEAPKAE